MSWSLLTLTTDPFWELSTGATYNSHTLRTETELWAEVLRYLPPPLPILGPNGLTPRWDLFCLMVLMTADECHQRAKEAKALAVQTQDLWERDMLLRIATQWQLLASHNVGKETPLQPLDAVRPQS
jgi:hypothetical protein